MLNISPEEVSEELAQRLNYGEAMTEETTAFETDVEVIILVRSNEEVVHKEQLSNMLSIIGLPPQLVGLYKIPCNDNDFFSARRFFIKEIWPHVQAVRPKLIVTLGAEAAYPFFEKNVIDKSDWFDTYHTRLHEKSTTLPVSGETVAFFVYPMPSLVVLDTNEAMRRVFDRQLRVLRGLLLELGVTKKREG